MSIDISVIIPVYNAEKYIVRCVKSVIMQSHKNIEIIIVNDGSNDQTEKIIDEMSEKDSRIHVLHKNNEGQGAARNDGINLAKGKFITFVDSDDWLEHDAYEKLLKRLQGNNPEILVFNYNMVYPDGKVECIKDFQSRNIDLSKIEIRGFLYDYFFKTQIGSSVWNKLYRADFIKRNVIYMGDTRIGEDFYFNLVSMVYAENITFLNDPLYNYFQPLESVTRKYSKGITKEYMTYLPKFIALLEKEGKLQEFYPFTSLIVYRAFSNGIYNAYSVDGRLRSISNEICSGLNINHVDKVLSDTLRFNYLSIVKPRILRQSIYILFSMLRLRAITLASVYQWARCRRIKIRKG